VNSDNGKPLFLIFIVPIPQLRDYVFTVDSAVGPKLD
jgi:hypothetical protein